MTSALRSLANTEFWSTPISKSRPVSDLNRVTRGGENCKAVGIAEIAVIARHRRDRKTQSPADLPFRSVSSVLISGESLAFQFRRSLAILALLAISPDPRSSASIRGKSFIRPFRSASSVLISGKLLPFLITRDHPIFSHSAPSVPPRFKAFAFQFRRSLASLAVGIY